MNIRRTGDLTAIGDLFATKQLQRQIKAAAGPTPIQRRLIDAAAAQQDDQSILYQHAVLCQTCLPYRDPGDEVREWERVNGNVILEVRAGKITHPTEPRLVKFGLPFGSKCRLVLMAINQIAVVKQTPHIEVEDSLTAFVRRVLNLDPKGRTIRQVKDQLQRLTASDITLGRVADSLQGTESQTRYLRVVEGFDVWMPKNENQRVLWKSVIDLSERYFNSLIEHAVPLDERHIAALSHSAMALDIYAWLAHRLHRVPAGKPVPISWGALHQQFGQGYSGDQAIKKFRQVFRTTLKDVLTLYKGARIKDEEPRPPRIAMHDGRYVWRERPAKGLMLYNSPPPVLKLPKLLKPSGV